MRIASLAAASGLLLYCAKANRDEQAEPLTSLGRLKDAYAAKVEEAKRDFDKETGWPSKEDCDGTLWAGLAKAGGAKDVRLGLAEYKPGEIHRRPHRSCWEPGKDHTDSASTVSRDMLLGYLYGLWRSGDREAVKRLASYGESHAWIMGRPETSIGETLLSGNMIGLLGRMQCKMDLGCPMYSKIPPIHSKSNKDYVRHLTAIIILLDGEVTDGLRVEYDPNVATNYPAEITTADIKESDKKYLEYNYAEDPKDALFCTAYHMYEDGKYDTCAEALLSGDYQYPTYVRGSDRYRLVHWLFTADLILRRYR